MASATSSAERLRVRPMGPAGPEGCGLQCLFHRLTGLRPGYHRDWAAVEAWATRIAAQLQTAPTPPRPS